MIKKPITIRLSSGLEARPVAMLVQVASQYESEIYVESGRKKRKCEEHYGYDDTWSGQWRGSYRDCKRKRRERSHGRR